MDDTSIRSPTPTWHDCHWYFLVFWCPHGVSCGDHLSLARHRSRQDVDAESSRSQRTCPIGTANGSPIPIPCGCARTRWHRLAEAETMGMAIGCGHHRNSGSGGCHKHFLRAHHSRRGGRHDCRRSPVLRDSTIRSRHFCSQTETNCSHRRPVRAFLDENSGFRSRGDDIRGCR